MTPHSSLFRELMDASMRAENYMYSTMTGLQRLTDLDAKQRLAPRFQYLVYVCNDIHLDMGHTYHGPVQQSLAFGLQYFISHLQHFVTKFHRLALKLRYLATEANRLHVMILEAALNKQVESGALAKDTVVPTRKRPTTRSQTPSKARRKRVRPTKALRS